MPDDLSEVEKRLDRRLQANKERREKDPDYRQKELERVQKEQQEPRKRRFIWWPF